MPGPSVTIEFHSDGSVTKSGFQLHYELIGTPSL